MRYMASCSRHNRIRCCTRSSLRLFLSLLSSYVMHIAVRNNRSLIRSKKNKTPRVRNLSLNNRRRRPSSRYIPENLITQVLARLPAKSVFRFRPVCKLWNSLTRDPQFIFQHMKLKRNCSKNPSGTLIIDYYDEYMHEPYSLYCYDKGCRRRLISQKRKFMMLLDFSPQETYYLVSNACDGLICLEDDYQMGKFRVINPATNEFVRLRFPPPHEIDWSNLALVRGVSISAEEERYKVVRVFYRDEHMCRTGCQILELGPGVEFWRDIGDTPAVVHLLRPPVVVGGSIYWQTHPDRFGIDGAVSLDIRSWKFGLVVPPKGMPRGTGMRTAELGGHLCLFSQTREEPRYMYLQIYAGGGTKKNGGGDSWRGYKLDLQGLVGFLRTEPVRMEDGKVLVASMGDGQFYVCDLDKGLIVEEPVNLGLKKFDFIPSYSGTLISPISPTAIRGLITKEATD